MRFSVVQEQNATWAVYDAIFELHAKIGGRLLTNLTRDEAERAAAIANAEQLRWRPAAASPQPSPVAA